MTHRPPAIILTGPTSGIGLATAKALAKLPVTLILVARNATKLDRVMDELRPYSSNLVPIICDLSLLRSVRAAITAIACLGIPLVGVVNNAGVAQGSVRETDEGIDETFATSYLGTYVLTQGLLPILQEHARIVFVVSATEDPNDSPSKRAGFKGGLHDTVEKSARGVFLSGGSTQPGFDAYASSKQCELAYAYHLAEVQQRVIITAVEPGFNPSTGLAKDASWYIRLGMKLVGGLLRLSPDTSGSLIAASVTQASPDRGVYVGDGGREKTPSAAILDEAFRVRLVAETEAYLASRSTI